MSSPVKSSASSSTPTKTESSISRPSMESAHKPSPPKPKTQPLVIDEFDGIDAFEEAESKKRKRDAATTSPSASKETHAKKEEADGRAKKALKLSESTTPASAAAPPATPPKAKRASSAKKGAAGPAMAVELGSPEKLAAFNIKTVEPEAVTVMYASYGNFMQRDGPPLHGMKEAPTGAPDCLKSFVFVITGVLESLERDEATELVERHGGTVSKTLGKRVTHAVVGSNAGPSKINQLAERKIPMIDEDGLFRLIRALSGQDVEGGGDKSTASDATADEAASDDVQILSTTKNDASSKESATSSSAPTTSKSPKTSPTKKTSAAAKKASAPVSLTVTLPSPVHPRISTMWTDKYAPVSSTDLVGNPGNVTKLKNWLNGWAANIEKTKEIDPSNGKPLHSFARAALLMGSPGIGKTCSALIIAKECGYMPIHLNASDQRSQKSLREHVAGLLSNHGINEFFGGGGIKRAKTVLLMDEIDGMSSGDRGGMAELSLMIKTTKVPIIAMANDKQKVRGLAQSTSVLPLGFSRPTIQQTFSRIAAIATNEGLTSLSDDTIRRIVESCQGDLRMTLNALQLISANPGALTRPNDNVVGPRGGNSTALDSHLRSAAKDVTLGPFDVVPKIFGTIVKADGKPSISFEDRLEHYFVDYSLVPLFVFQNYIKTKTRGPLATADKRQALADLKSVRLAAQSICDADVIGASIFSHQNFSLLPVHGVISTMRPAALLNSHGTAVEFPQILGKGSSQRKRLGLLSELSAEMYTTTGGAGPTGVGLDYMSLLARNVTEPLVTQHQAGIPIVLGFMEEYGISKEGRDSILEIAELKQDKSDKKGGLGSDIASGTKAAFTRAYNAGSHIVKIKRKKKAAGADDEDAEAMLDAADDASEDEEENIEDDTLVHIAKPKKAKTPAKAKSTAAKLQILEDDEPPKPKRAKSTGTKK